MWPYSKPQIPWVSSSALWHESGFQDVNGEIANVYFHPSDQWTNALLVQVVEPISSSLGSVKFPKLGLFDEIFEKWFHNARFWI
jgi:hypothetical protein